LPSGVLHRAFLTGLLRGLLTARPEIAGAAPALLVRLLSESESVNAEKVREIEEHRRQAMALLPETAEAYFLRAMTAVHETRPGHPRGWRPVASAGPQARGTRLLLHAGSGKNAPWPLCQGAPADYRLLFSLLVA